MNIIPKVTCLLLLILCTARVSPSWAGEQLITENQAKVAFVFNVIRYVNWPPPVSDTLQIGILGKGLISSEWMSISGKIANGKKLHVFKSNDLEDMFDCQIIFIEETSPRKLSRILLSLRNYPILTIGDSPIFITSGGSMNVFLRNNHISFLVNLIQARAVGLDISSNLLKLATEVIK